MMNKNYRSAENRTQLSLFADHLDQHIAPDNTIRAIDAFVASLDLERLGVNTYQNSATLRGQPAFDPSFMVRLYLYGYLNGIRSSRKLEKECHRNIELMWLLGNQRPSYKTIANFRKDNADLLVKINSRFVQLCRHFELIGGEVVAIDGSFFHANASLKSIKTRKTLQVQLAQIEQSIEDYHQSLDLSDKKESAQSEPTISLAELETKKQAMVSLVASLEANGETQISFTDENARRLNKGKGTVAGYNIQTVVDAKYKLIVASEVTNDGNDQKQLYPMASLVRKTLNIGPLNTLTVLADAGYYESSNIIECQKNAIEAYVPIPQKVQKHRSSERIETAQFQYDDENNRYVCPSNQLLLPSGQLQSHRNSKRQRFESKESVCKSCSLEENCLAPGAKKRTIYRNERAAELETHQARMGSEHAKGKMKMRSALVEHPFGTLKSRAGWQHFLVRGFKKVRGEWAMMMLAYNFTRVLNILGMDQFLVLCELYAQALYRYFKEIVGFLMRIEGPEKQFRLRKSFFII